MVLQLPNVLIIGDSISEPGSGYGPGVENILMQPGIPWRNQSGALADVQHNGAKGSNQAGPTTNGAACIGTWLGKEKWVRQPCDRPCSPCACCVLCCVLDARATDD